MKNGLLISSIACLLLTGNPEISLGANVVVSLPSGIPSTVLFGLFENPGVTWMKNSGVPWNAFFS